VESGDEISIHYDPMIAKLTVWDTTRPLAIARLRQMLARTAVFGLTTNLDLLYGIAGDPDFASGEYDTGFIENRLDTLLAGGETTPAILAAAASGSIDALTAAVPVSEDAHSPWRRRDGWHANTNSGFRIILRDASSKDHTLAVRGEARRFSMHMADRTCSVTTRPDNNSGALSLELDDERRTLYLLRYNRHFQIADQAQRIALDWIDPLARSAAAGADEARPVSPMPGRIVAIHVAEGDTVEPGQPLLVLEGMKMEYTLKAAVAGTVAKLLHRKDDSVEAETPLVEISPLEAKEEGNS
jgi:3-methylcrotonyl-CoA carboxylase alpha subunit